VIPYGRQEITQADIAAVTAVLCSDHLTQGAVVPAFEQAVSDYCKVKHAVAVNSATSALHLACLALGLGPGENLWTSPITFVASANCALYCGAEVDFVDINADTANLSVDRLEEKLIEAKRRGRLPKIVVPVHLCGQPCDMKRIWELSQVFGFRIIEDASHAIGARYQGEPVGNCRYSDITIFSFHPVKIITTGEGGMTLTNDAKFAQKMALLRSHGITRDPSLMTHEPDGPWYYQQLELGYNYRMTDIQAALGLSQMDRLDDYVAKRRNLAAQYDTGLRDLPLSTIQQHPNGSSAFHLYPVRVLPNGEKTRRVIFDLLRDEGIGVNIHYIPVHFQHYYKNIGFKEGDFPEAERYYSEAISLPLFPTLKNEEQTKVVELLKKMLL